MSIRSWARKLAAFATIGFIGSQLVSSSISAQEAGGEAAARGRVVSPHFRVDASVDKLEMVHRTSRILTMDYRVPRMLVNNTEIIKVTPLSPNQIQVSALKPGVTQLNIWDEDDKVMSIDVIVYGDARELENILRVQFPDASIRVSPLASGVVVSGFVPEADMMAKIVETARDYYPKVINNLTVGGCQKILLHTKVMEISRTKLRKLGFDWAAFGSGGDYVVQSASGLISAFSATPGGVSTATGSGGATVQFGIVNGGSQFFGFLEALRQNNLAKVLAEPTLVTLHGRPATFNSGGEFPILVPQSLGTVSIQYRQYGTRVDFVPIVLGKQAVRLEVRPQVTEIDRSTAVNINNIAVPGLRTRMVETGVEMKAGQTLALAGLLSEREEIENKGLPFLADLPYIGVPFRRTQTLTNEIELLITVTPEFAEAIDPEELPPCGPGQFSTAPEIGDQFFRGYTEVPSCRDCQTIQMDGGRNAYRDEAPLTQAAHVAPAPGKPSQAAVARKAPAYGPAPATHADPAYGPATNGPSPAARTAANPNSESQSTRRTGDRSSSAKTPGVKPLPAIEPTKDTYPTTKAAHVPAELTPKAASRFAAPAQSDTPSPTGLNPTSVNKASESPASPTPASLPSTSLPSASKPAISATPAEMRRNEQIFMRPVQAPEATPASPPRLSKPVGDNPSQFPENSLRSPSDSSIRQEATVRPASMSKKTSSAKGRLTPAFPSSKNQNTPASPLPSTGTRTGERGANTTTSTENTPTQEEEASLR